MSGRTVSKSLPDESRGGGVHASRTWTRKPRSPPVHVYTLYPGEVVEGDVVDRNPSSVRYPRYILSDGRLQRVVSKKPDVSIDFP